MRAVPIASIAIALTGVLLTSCSETAGVLPRLSATYVLETVNGEQLPSVSPDGNTPRLIRLADTLVFSADGNLDRRVTVRVIGRSTLGSDTTMHSIQPLSYTVHGDHLTIHVRSCPANANCVGASDGRIDARRVDLVDAGWDSATLHFTVR
jgi:hypothetical protein